jgi:hypothetical protein
MSEHHDRVRQLLARVQFDLIRADKFKEEHPTSEWDTANGTMVMLFSDGEWRQFGSLNDQEYVVRALDKMRADDTHIIAMISLVPLVMRGFKVNNDTP